MIKKQLVFFLFVAIIYSCTNETKKEPVTDIEVANSFVRNLLDNDFKNAEKYLLKDSVNVQLFERFQKQYNQQSKETLNRYKEADIIINETSNITDSVFIFNYSNSYKPASKTVLKLVRPADKWLIDLKYTFSGNL